MTPMSSPWLDSKTPVGPPTAANPTVRQLVYAGVVTGVWSGLICLIIYVIASLAGVDFVLKAPSEELEVRMPWLAFLLVPLAFAILGALLASLVRGWRGARRIVFWLGTLLALGTTVVPLTQPDSVGWMTTDPAGDHARDHLVPRRAADRPDRRRLRAGPARRPRRVARLRM